MSNMPTFKFATVDLTDEQYEKENTQVSKFLAAGRHTLQIVALTFTQMSAKDPTWANFKATLAAVGSKVVRDGDKVSCTLDGAPTPSHTVFLSVPTDSLRYNPTNSKNPTFMLRKLQEFLTGAGFDLLPSNAKQLIPKLFSDKQELVGRVIDVNIGYTQAHVEYRDGKYVGVDKDGNVMTDAVDSRDAAEGSLYAMGLPANKVQRFMDITRYYPTPEQPKPTKGKKPAPKIEEPTEEWDD